MADTVRKSLLRKASMSKSLSARVALAVKNPRPLTSFQRREFIEALHIVRGTKAAAGPEMVTKMPGFSPMQLRAQIDKVASIRQEIDILKAQYEAQIKQYEATLKAAQEKETEESAGIALLKKAADEMGKKGKFAVEAEKALLEWTAFTQEKRPGIEQMIAKADDPDIVKKGLKAGDLFGRISEKLGAEIATTVEVLYKQCSEDLSHTAQVIKGLKVVIKTSSLNPEMTKRAGILDVVVGIKEWVGGKMDAAAAKFMGFMGDIHKWFKLFAARTEIAEKAKSGLLKALKEAESETDKLLKMA